MPNLATLFDSDALAPHGVCLLWRPELLWLHVVSDALIGLAYWSIPIVLIVIARRRRDLAFPWTFELFALFILACGATHFLSIWTLWYPDYGLEGAVKAVTAVVSVVTAIALWPLLPRVLALPSSADLARANTALSREVAERREAEARARQSEARLAGFFEHMSDALFVVRAERGGFVFETVNPSFVRLFGRPREAIEGSGPDVLLDAVPAAELASAFATCFGTGAPRDWESTITGPEGTRHWHTVLAPLPDIQGEPRRLLGSLRDVTELRRLQTDLVEAARRATIGAMCAGVAHEMSQPVNIISLWADRARATLEVGTGARRAIEVILGQTRRLGALLERMRELARDTPGEAETFDAAEAAAAAVEVARRSWSLDRIEVTLDASEPAPVLGRPAQFEQALLHLLENARDAVLRRRRQEPDALAQIQVTLRAGPQPGQMTLAVQDTGGGVPASLGARILEPFVTSKDPGEGTGLGLPIAAGILRGMGGRLAWLNRGAGAVFQVALPLVREHPA
ncbi:two-component system sensor histidine kinase NtrB [Belnapia rosea]|uniref:two-component system sensor histidine kinase NtrB n=1 Tax=Belnapia rosea TaxID=938405 RepID=UPI000881FC56|nr:ATP-binding protein [Belnapia rosea]SDB57373.1 PAS domain S-box-containing protein [Belnapia rosea]